jgi:NAD dependent epimerase/dehydratase family enzyme
MGSGRQFVPWIHRDDWVALVMWLIAEPGLSGPFNATAPEPVRNAEFAAALQWQLGDQRIDVVIDDGAGDLAIAVRARETGRRLL